MSQSIDSAQRIKGKNKNHKEEIIILDGHHRSYAKKNCSVDPIENVIIVSSKSGETAKQTVKNILNKNTNGYKCKSSLN